MGTLTRVEAIQKVNEISEQIKKNPLKIFEYTEEMDKKYPTGEFKKFYSYFADMGLSGWYYDEKRFCTDVLKVVFIEALLELAKHEEHFQKFKHAIKIIAG